MRLYFSSSFFRRFKNKIFFQQTEQKWRNKWIDNTESNEAHRNREQEREREGNAIHLCLCAKKKRQSRGSAWMKNAHTNTRALIDTNQRYFHVRLAWCLEFDIANKQTNKYIYIFKIWSFLCSVDGWLFVCVCVHGYSLTVPILSVSRIFFALFFSLCLCLAYRDCVYCPKM